MKQIKEQYAKEKGSKSWNDYISYIIELYGVDEINIIIDDLMKSASEKPQ